MKMFKKLISVIISSIIMFNLCVVVNAEDLVDTVSAKDVITETINSYPDSYVIEWYDDISYLPETAEIVDAQYQNPVVKKYTVDLGAVSMNISEYKNESVYIDLVTVNTNYIVDLPSIVINEDDFVFATQKTDYRTDYNYSSTQPVYHGDVTDVKQYNDNIVTHKVQVRTSNTRGEQFATIRLEKRLKTANRHIVILGYAKLANLNADELDTSWLRSNGIEIVYARDMRQNFVTDVYSEDMNSTYAVFSKPRLSEIDEQRVNEFFGNGFVYSKCVIDALSDYSATPVMSTMYDIHFDENLVARPKYTVGQTLGYFDKAAILPKIMFDSESELEMQKLTEYQRYIKSLESQLNEKSNEIARLRCGGDVNGDGEIDAADAQLILTYYVATLAGETKSLPEWIGGVIE